MSLRNHRKKSKKVFYGLILLLLVSAVSIASYMFYFQQKKNADTSNRDRAQQIKEDLPTISKKGTESEPTSSSTQDQPTSQDIPTSESLSITNLSFTQDSGFIKAQVLVNGVGQCVFQYTKDNNKPVINQVNSSSGQCMSTIPEPQFVALGSWNLRVIYYADGKKTEISKDVTVH